MEEIILPKKPKNNKREKIELNSANMLPNLYIYIKLNTFAYCTTYKFTISSIFKKIEWTIIEWSGIISAYLVSNAILVIADKSDLMLEKS